MAELHSFTTTVVPRNGQVIADDWLATHGRPHPRRRHLALGFDWACVDTSTGLTVASGVCDDEEDAEDQAAKALEEARRADEARVMAEHAGA